MAGSQVKVLVRREERVPAGDSQLGNECVDRSDLDTGGAQRVPDTRSCDVVVSPTSPFPAFPIGAKSDDPLAMYLCDYFTIPADLAGLAAGSVPVGATRAGLPVGFQIAAPVLREDLVFRVAAELERVHGPAPLPEAYR